MTKPSRPALLLLTLAALVLAGSQWAAWSPARGWMARAARSANTWFVRATAATPCSPCEWTEASVAGFRLAQPAHFRALVGVTEARSLRRTTWSLLTWDGGGCSLEYSLSALPAGKRQDEVDARTRGLTRGEPVHGWAVWTGRGRFSFSSTLLVGERTLITVDGHLDDRLEGTDLARWFEQTVRECARKTAEGNEPGREPEEADRTVTVHIRFPDGTARSAPLTGPEVVSLLHEDFRHTAEWWIRGAFARLGLSHALGDDPTTGRRALLSVGGVSNDSRGRWVLFLDGWHHKAPVDTPLRVDEREILLAYTACLDAEPAVVTLSGNIRLRYEPRAGGRSETVWSIELDEPICVAGSADVGEVHLLGRAEGEPPRSSYFAQEGQGRVRARGTLVPYSGGPPGEPLLFRPRTLEPSPREPGLR